MSEKHEYALAAYLALSRIFLHILAKCAYRIFWHFWWH